jgi:hypothetical protein
MGRLREVTMLAGEGGGCGYQRTLFGSKEMHIRDYREKIAIVGVK